MPFSSAVPFDQTVLFFALLDTKLDLLIEHFDRLTEGLTEFRVTMQEGFTSHDIRLDRIVEATERQATVTGVKVAFLQPSAMQSLKYISNASFA